MSFLSSIVLLAICVLRWSFLDFCDAFIVYMFCPCEFFWVQIILVLKFCRYDIDLIHQSYRQHGLLVSMPISIYQTRTIFVERCTVLSLECTILIFLCGLIQSLHFGLSLKHAKVCFIYKTILIIPKLWTLVQKLTMICPCRSR
jgi:hypothetical protein